jgi:hypothetical protein
MTAKKKQKTAKKPRQPKIRIPLPFETAVEGLVRVKIKRAKKEPDRE